jgi:hypothetical protein
MNESKSNVSTIGWLSVLFAIGAAVTCALFLVFVPGPERGMTFYVAMSIVVAVELVLFAHLAYSRLARAYPPGPSRAIRLEIHALIIIWLVVTIITTIFAVRPENADTFTADKILVIYLLATFLFFLAAYFLYSNSIEVEKTDAKLVAERRSITSKTPDIEHAIRLIEEIGRLYAEHSILADSTCKKLNTLRSNIESVFVSERALSQNSGDRRDWNSQLEKLVSELISLSDSASIAVSEDIPELLKMIASKAEVILVTLRKRRESITT